MLVNHLVSGSKGNVDSGANRSEGNAALIGRLALAVVRQALRVGSAGLVTGAIAGWVGYLEGGHRSQQVGADAAPWYWLFVAVCPLVLILRSRPSRPATLQRSDRVRGAVLLTASGLVAAAVGTVLHLVVAILLPAAVGIAHLDAQAIRQGLLSNFPLVALPVVAVLVVAAAVFVAFAPARKKRS